MSGPKIPHEITNGYVEQSSAGKAVKQPQTGIFNTSIVKTLGTQVTKFSDSIKEIKDAILSSLSKPTNEKGNHSAISGKMTVSYKLVKVDENNPTDFRAVVASKNQDKENSVNFIGSKPEDFEKFNKDVKNTIECIITHVIEGDITKDNATSFLNTIKNDVDKSLKFSKAENAQKNELLRHIKTQTKFLAKVEVLKEPKKNLKDLSASGTKFSCIDPEKFGANKFKTYQIGSGAYRLIVQTMDKSSKSENANDTHHHTVTQLSKSDSKLSVTNLFTTSTTSQSTDLSNNNIDLEDTSNIDSRNLKLGSSIKKEEKEEALTDSESDDSYDESEIEDTVSNPQTDKDTKHSSELILSLLKQNIIKKVELVGDKNLDASNVSGLREDLEKSILKDINFEKPKVLGNTLYVYTATQAIEANKALAVINNDRTPTGNKAQLIKKSTQMNQKYTEDSKEILNQFSKNPPLTTP